MVNSIGETVGKSINMEGMVSGGNFIMNIPKVKIGS